MSTKAIFEGLVFDEENNPVDIRVIGGEAFYVVNDDGFLRHISSEYVDRQVIDQLQKQSQIHLQALHFHQVEHHMLL